jgi:hypothetical protein
MCSDCLKRYGKEVADQHPPIHPNYEHQFIPFRRDPEECCESPNDCADYKLGICDPDVNRD